MMSRYVSPCLLVALVFVGCAKSDLSTPRQPSHFNRFPKSYTGPEHFATVEELKNWAKSENIFCQLHEFEVLQRKIYVADRCWTSGILSSEVGVYVPAATGLVLRHSIPVQPMFFHIFAVKDDRLLILRYDNSKEAKVVAELSSSELFDF
ncbi:hypothetical protein ACFL1X_12720 [Candidatus Hydrogenedentota bacterium]